MTIQLIHGDSLELIESIAIPGNTVTITDPPYGMEKEAWDKRNKTTWLPIDSDSWLPTCREFGPVAIFTGIKGSQYYPPSDWIMCWLKMGSTQRMGRLCGFTNWEPILLYGIKKLSHDVIRCPNYHEDFGHPTTKPLPLMVELINRLTQPGDTVLDCFMGSGTTGVACVQTGRSFIGIEIDPGYFAIAEKRIAEAQLQVRMQI